MHTLYLAAAAANRGSVPIAANSTRWSGRRAAIPGAAAGPGRIGGAENPCVGPAPAPTDAGTRMPWAGDAPGTGDGCRMAEAGTAIDREGVTMMPDPTVPDVTACCCCGLETTRATFAPPPCGCTGKGPDVPMAYGGEGADSPLESNGPDPGAEPERCVGGVEAAAGAGAGASAGEGAGDGRRAPDVSRRIDRNAAVASVWVAGAGAGAGAGAFWCCCAVGGETMSPGASSGRDDDDATVDGGALSRNAAGDGLRPAHTSTQARTHAKPRPQHRTGRSLTVGHAVGGRVKER